MSRPPKEWMDNFRALLMMYGIVAFSQGELKLAHDMGPKLYELGLDELAAAEKALRDVKQAAPAALVDAEILMAKSGVKNRPEMEEFWRSMGIDPKDWPT